MDIFVGVYIGPYYLQRAFCSHLLRFRPVYTRYTNRPWRSLKVYKLALHCVEIVSLYSIAEGILFQRWDVQICAMRSMSTLAKRMSIKALCFRNWTRSLVSSTGEYCSYDILVRIVFFKRMSSITLGLGKPISYCSVRKAVSCTFSVKLYRFSRY